MCNGEAAMRELYQMLGTSQAVVLRLATHSDALEKELVEMGRRVDNLREIGLRVLRESSMPPELAAEFAEAIEQIIWPKCPDILTLVKKEEK